MPARDLHSRTGCDMCRRRRKKCDEQKPICAPCTRLSLRCTWQSYSASATLIHAPAQPSSTYPTESFDVKRNRTCDREIQPIVPSSYNVLATNFARGQALPTLTTDFSRAFDEHVIICGTFGNWTDVSKQFALDAQWSHLMQIDEVLKACGHGPVTRMACAWYFRKLMKFFAIESDPQRMDSLPSWLVPRGSQLTSTYPDVINYFPWPPVREELIQKQSRYCNDTWWTQYTNVGFRFIWPFEPSDAFVWDSASSMLQASPEFLLRVQNIRSFALSKDFLAISPEFRGKAPQLESSATLFTPLMEGEFERLFWAYMREHRSKSKDSTQRKPRRSLRIQPGFLPTDTEHDGHLASSILRATIPDSTPRLPYANGNDRHM